MLYMFDIDGTLIRSFLREAALDADYDDVEVLPRRLGHLFTLAQQRGTRFALITNQAGVAMGYQTPQQVWEKMGRIVAAFEGFYSVPFSIHVCMHHPKAKLEEWQMDPCPRRKPEAGMIREAIGVHQMAGLSVENILFVGDMDSDRAAAENAAVGYQDADVFFA